MQKMAQIRRRLARRPPNLTDENKPTPTPTPKPPQRNTEANSEGHLTDTPANDPIRILESGEEEWKVGSGALLYGLPLISRRFAGGHGAA